MKQTNFSKKEQSDSKALNDFLHSFSKNQMMAEMDRICEGCLVPRTTLKNWMYGRCRIPELYKHKIEEIIGTAIFHAEERR